MLATIAYFATDVYLPAMPEICEYFKVDENAMQRSVSLFTLGIASSQIFYGALSDKYGRKISICSGLLFSLIGTYMLVIAESISTFNIARLLQGLGLGCCVAVPRSILPDLYSGKKLAIYGSYLAMAVPIVLSGAPIIGGYIQHIYSWKDIFKFLFAYVILLNFIVIFFLPETNKNKNSKALNITVIARNLITICSDRKYISGTICSCSLMAALFFYVAASPFIIQEQANATVIEYSWIMGANGLMIMIGAVFNKKLLAITSLDRTVKIGAVLTILSGLVLFIVNSLMPHVTPLSIALPCFFVFIASAFTFPNSLAICLKNVCKTMTGVAVAMFSTVQMLGAFLGSYATSIISNDGIISLSAGVIIAGFVSLMSISLRGNK